MIIFFAWLMQRLNVWKWTPLRSCNVRQKLTKWDLKDFKQEKQEDSVRGERRTVPLPPSDRALCTDSPAGHGCVGGRTGHVPDTAALGSWVHGWRRGICLPLWAAGRGLASLWCLAPCCLGKSIKKKRSERGLVLHHHQASQGQDSHSLYPWAGLAQPPVGALAHVLPPVVAHKQMLSFTYFLTQKEEKWVHKAVTMITT